MSAGVANDVCGHIIASVLGGSGRDQFNVFPQNRDLNNGPWKQLERRVKVFIEEGGPTRNRAANMRFWFDYRTPRATRPYAFTLTVNLLEGQRILGEGEVLRVENRRYIRPRARG